MFDSLASPTFLFMLLFSIFAIFMVYSAILMYHWFKYAMNTTAATAISVVYMSSAFVLFFIMIIVSSSLI